ncbi:MAG: amino acid permease [Nitrososphaeraceae archaeon]
MGLILGAGIAGNAMWISFIIAAFIALLTGLSYAELSSIFPKNAAEYIFAKNIFGNDLAASIIVCLIIFVAVVSEAIGFSQYVQIFLPQISTGVTAIVLISILFAVNFYGISESIRINTIFTFIKLGGLIIIIIAGR